MSIKIIHKFVYKHVDQLKKLNIPKSPGCYQFLDKLGKIIYIGKAANLQSRVFSYWQKSSNHSPAKYSMMKQICKIEWIETESEIEALLLEANLIKKHQPQYNIVMRDDKRYVYIKVSTEEDWPRVFMSRQIDKSGRYFGPFVSTENVKMILKVIRKIWPYRSCRALPKGEKACLYYSLNKCPGMCINKISHKEYKSTIKHIINFLEKGKINQKLDDINIKNILAQANPISLSNKYAADVIELAKVLGLKKVPQRIEGYDIANIFGKAAVGSMVVFNDGTPNNSEYRKFKIKIGQGEANDVKMLKEVLIRRFNKRPRQNNSYTCITSSCRLYLKNPSKYPDTLQNFSNKPDINLCAKCKSYFVADTNNWLLPDLIIVDGGKGQLNAALSVLKKAKLDIPTISISKGRGLRSSVAPDKLFFPGEKKPLELSLNSPALHLLKRVRDEAHRFAISYHRKLRKKSFLNN